MTNIAVVYCSRYGSTKQYAQWLAEDLGADLYDVRRVYKEKLEPMIRLSLEEACTTAS